MTRKTGRTVLKWLLLCILLAYAVGMSVWASGRAEQRICTGVEVKIDGVRPELAATISAGIKSHLQQLVQVQGKPVGSLDLHAIQHWVSSLNNLEKASCAFAPDGHLVIHAKALVPEMRVFGPGGQSYYINGQGKRMEARQEFFVDVPLVSGRFDKNFSETALLPLIRYLNADAMLGSVITMVDVHSPSDIRLIPRMQGHVVELGDTSNLERKLTALKAFYRKVLPTRGWQTYKSINLGFDGRVIATLRYKPSTPTTELDTVPDAEEQALSESEIDAPATPAPLTQTHSNP